ncbi:flagellar basal body rod C-terminal domain-containing protein, partial [Enterococcus hirae]|uniref:flagellar basal body rod C-terminal domain-containing protein n=1 Tax=Enterococcus hirae TaxID=1354 RepID=UPI0013AD7D4C
IASSVASWVNTMHATGVDLSGTAGAALFGTNDGSSTITAGNITAMITDPSELAASATPAAGVTDYSNDGSNALAIGNFATAKTGPTGVTAQNPGSLWKAYVANLGTQSASATQKATTAAGLLTTATTNQQSLSGVNMDEETANLLVLQRSYQGAARVMSAIDSMLDTLINHTGS